MWQIFMELAKKEHIELPALEVAVLLALMAICLATRHTRIGLVATYLFAYRWGWNLFAGHSTPFLTAYLVFGTVTGILTVVALMTEKND